MTFLAYSAGALAIHSESKTPWNWHSFAWGYLCLFCLEVATVFANDIYDLKSDQQNAFYGPFSGGSRMLVEQRIGPRNLKKAAVVVTALGITAGALALWNATEHSSAAFVALVCVGFFALAYTVPPFKLSHRGLGELDVCLTHSFGVILCGYLLQGGRWYDAFPWLLAIPLFFVILPAILLAGIPDREADQATGKRTLVVSLGDKLTITLSMVCVIVAVACGLAWSSFDITRGAYDGLGWIAVPHGLWLLRRLSRTGRQLETTRRMDGTIALALLLILWFAILMTARLLISAV
jgi:predicted ribosomally synthesized peptide with SipW-like signal peptide